MSSQPIHYPPKPAPLRPLVIAGSALAATTVALAVILALEPTISSASFASLCVAEGVTFLGFTAAIIQRLRHNPKPARGRPQAPSRFYIYTSSAALVITTVALTALLINSPSLPTGAFTALAEIEGLSFILFGVSLYHHHKVKKRHDVAMERIEARAKQERAEREAARRAQAAQRATAPVVPPPVAEGDEGSGVMGAAPVRAVTDAEVAQLLLDELNPMIDALEDFLVEFVRAHKNNETKVQQIRDAFEGFRGLFARFFADRPDWVVTKKDAIFHVTRNNADLRSFLVNAFSVLPAFTLEANAESIAHSQQFIGSNYFNPPQEIEERFTALREQLGDVDVIDMTDARDDMALVNGFLHLILGAVGNCVTEAYDPTDGAFAHTFTRVKLKANATRGGRWVTKKTINSRLKDNPHLVEYREDLMSAIGDLLDGLGDALYDATCNTNNNFYRRIATFRAQRTEVDNTLPPSEQICAHLRGMAARLGEMA